MSILTVWLTNERLAFHRIDLSDGFGKSMIWLNWQMFCFRVCLPLIWAGQFLLPSSTHQVSCRQTVNAPTFDWYTLAAVTWQTKASDTPCQDWPIGLILTYLHIFPGTNWFVSLPQATIEFYPQYTCRLGHDYNRWDVCSNQGVITPCSNTRTNRLSS